MLAFTSVYFFKSGLFNGLRPIQIKKLTASKFQVVRQGSNRPCDLVPADFALPFPPYRPRATQFSIADDHSNCFRFTQENARLSFANGHLDPASAGMTTGGFGPRQPVVIPAQAGSSRLTATMASRRARYIGNLATVRSAEGMTYGRYPFAWIPACARIARGGFGPRQPTVIPAHAGIQATRNNE